MKLWRYFFPLKHEWSMVEWKQLPIWRVDLFLGAKTQIGSRNVGICSCLKCGALGHLYWNSPEVHCTVKSCTS